MKHSISFNSTFCSYCVCNVHYEVETLPFEDPTGYAYKINQDGMFFTMRCGDVAKIIWKSKMKYNGDNRFWLGMNCRLARLVKNLQMIQIIMLSRNRYYKEINESFFSVFNSFVIVT